VDLVEEFDGDGIVSSLGEVDTAFEVASAQMETNSHIGLLTRKTVIVQFDVRVENLVRVDADLLHALNHADGTEVSEERIIYLNVSAAGLVQVGDFLTVCLGDVGKVSLLIGIRLLGEGVVTVTKMEPFGSGLSSGWGHEREYHGHLDILDFIGRNILCKEFESWNVTRTNTTNLAGTKPRLRTLESLSLESRNVGDI